MTGRSSGRETRARSLVAGVGNVLRGDDGFGPAVARALESAEGLPEGVKVIEVGIGGMGIVHELMSGYDRLVIVDAMDRGGPPGTLYLVEPDLPAGTGGGEDERRALSADMHEIVPERVLLLARALSVLPEEVTIVGCQPAETEELSLELSPVVGRTVPAAAAAVLELVGHQEGTDRTTETRP